MIEITAKQLYDIYQDLNAMSKSITYVKGTFEWFQVFPDIRKKSPEPLTLEFIRIDGEWKPTTDLIIKA